jgi:anti-sigma factor RsiW
MSMNPTSSERCPTEQALSAYHDGELSPADRAEMARHLVWCEACMQQLAQLKQMSGLLTSMSPEGLSQIAWHRLHAKLDEVLERGLVRWAWEVSAIAAAILLISSVCLMRISEPNSTTAAVSAVNVPGFNVPGSNVTGLNVPGSNVMASNIMAAVPPWVHAQASADPVLSEPATTPAQAWYLADARGSSEVAP